MLQYGSAKLWEPYMRINLSELKPNPYRDYKIDPIDKDHVKELAESIKEHGFWRGVAARKFNGEYQLAMGHHRIEAAKLAGIIEEEIHIADYTDMQMVRIYAEENATQRGIQIAAAQSGSVAGAIRFLAKDMLQNSKLAVNSGLAALQHKASLLSEKKGIGIAVVVEFFRGIPGMTKNSISNELANLKESGEYTRIIQEVQKEIEKSGASKEIIETARKAVEAAKSEPTFDLRGTLQHFKTDDHVRKFREMVTGPGVQPYLPVEQQKNVAKALVDLREELNKESGKDQRITAEFIHDNLMDMVKHEKGKHKALTKKEIKAMHDSDIMQKWRHYMKMFCRNARSTVHMGEKMAALIKENEGTTFPQSAEFREMRIVMKKVFDKLHVEV
jgi:hypothetical protein